jgi:hypothetical protein
MADRSKLKFSPHWLLFFLTLGVLMLSSLAFVQPASQIDQTPTPSPMALAVPSEEAMADSALTSTAEMEDLPPTPEEIGYTNGIIFCSTVLVLILLVGTLRETIRREGR